MGRASQASTLTAALTPLTGRTPVPANLFTVCIDDDGANLGNTQKTLFVRDLTLTINTGLTPKYTLDGRGDLDLTGINAGSIGGTLSMTAEVSADAATEIGPWSGQTVITLRR